jgi:hypothetical protein
MFFNEKLPLSSKDTGTVFKTGFEQLPYFANVLAQWVNTTTY